MSFQAYLDAIEDKTGKTPRVLVDEAGERGYDAADVKAGVIVGWLKNEYGLGRGHAMALVHVIKNGPKISAKHVGSAGSHRDDSDTLWLDGKATGRSRRPHVRHVRHGRSPVRSWLDRWHSQPSPRRRSR
ncbi:DUF4287 domain-containing protein [Micromonospora tulbaghiae]|uniref:DUF4287 domain-containing protein n=1 Tax=Micromonospora tulbaghiae TaxID=479978 RepID=UPI003EC093B6